MFHTKTAKDNALHRMKIARGHLDKVIQMVEEDAYCIDILMQSKAVQSGLSKADEVLLNEHLSTCVVDHIAKGESHHAIQEVMNIFKKSARH